ncbi:MAG: hypothetical protein R3D29_10410 [Nitratireductor sp.]
MIALFDKTGTLTTGMPQPVGHENTPAPMINLATALPAKASIRFQGRSRSLPDLLIFQPLVPFRNCPEKGSRQTAMAARSAWSSRLGH